MFFFYTSSLTMWWGGVEVTHDIALTAVGNGISDQSSNPGQGSLHFTLL